jgi:hypothetical protein
MSPRFLVNYKTMDKEITEIQFNCSYLKCQLTESPQQSFLHRNACDTYQLGSEFCQLNRHHRWNFLNKLSENVDL